MRDTRGMRKGSENKHGTQAQERLIKSQRQGFRREAVRGASKGIIREAYIKVEGDSEKSRVNTMLFFQLSSVFFHPIYYLRPAESVSISIVTLVRVRMAGSPRLPPPQYDLPSSTRVESSLLERRGWTRKQLYGDRYRGFYAIQAATSCPFTHGARRLPLAACRTDCTALHSIGARVRKLSGVKSETRIRRRPSSGRGQQQQQQKSPNSNPNSLYSLLTLTLTPTPTPTTWKVTGTAQS